MTINTTIEGDPESIRSAATWLRATFSGAVYDSVTQLYHARGNSESCWEGDAGEGFRTRMTAAGRKGDAMADGADRAGQAFEGYAGDLQTGQIGMERARQIARDGGLEVTDDQILDPSPAPTAPAALPADATPLQVQSYNDGVAAQQAHAQQVAAYAAAGEEAERARRTVADGIREFYRRITREAMEKGWFIAADAANGAVGAAAAVRAQNLFNTADVLTDQKRSSDDIYRRMQHDTPEARARETARGQALWQEADRTTRQGTSIARRFGARIPVIGVGITAAGTGYGISQGKPVGKSVVSGVAGVAGGAAGGVVGGVAAGAMFGSAVGPVGTVVGGVAGGVIAGVGAEWSYDELPDGVTDAIEGGFESAGSGVRDAWNSVF